MIATTRESAIRHRRANRTVRASGSPVAPAIREPSRPRPHAQETCLSRVTSPRPKARRKVDESLVGDPRETHHDPAITNFQSPLKIVKLDHPLVDLPKEFHDVCGCEVFGSCSDGH